LKWRYDLKESANKYFMFDEYLVGVFFQVPTKDIKYFNPPPDISNASNCEPVQLLPLKTILAASRCGVVT